MAKYLASVRYSAYQCTENFVSDVDGLKRETPVIVRTNRGTEVGKIVSRVFELPPDSQIKGFGEILRRMTPADAERARYLEYELRFREHQRGQELIERHQLPMKLVYAEHLFGGEKIIFYFLAESRVDFRALVRDLAREFHTRIELRQIGVRDEARLLAEYEACGQRLCCKQFLLKLEPVSMRMAKLQKATLDPGKISGRCGRLKCCLRYEDEVYAELREKLPPKGARVRTATVTGVVVGAEILPQTVTITLEDGAQVKASVGEILEVLPPEAGGTAEALPAAFLDDDATETSPVGLEATGEQESLPEEEASAPPTAEVVVEPAPLSEARWPPLQKPDRTAKMFAKESAVEKETRESSPFLPGGAEAEAGAPPQHPRKRKTRPEGRPPAAPVAESPSTPSSGGAGTPTASEKNAARRETGGEAQPRQSATPGEAGPSPSPRSSRRRRRRRRHQKQTDSDGNAAADDT